MCLWMCVMAAAWSSEPTWDLEVRGFAEEPVPEWATAWADTVRKSLSTCMPAGQQPGWMAVRLVAKPSKKLTPSVRADASTTTKTALCVLALGDDPAPSTEAREAHLWLAVHTGTAPPVPSVDALPLPEAVDIGDLLGAKGIQIPVAP